MERQDHDLPEGLRPDDGRHAPYQDISGGQRGPAIRTDGLSAEDNRGRLAPQSGSGVVIGAGASAGGSNGAGDDYDSDSAAGSGPAATSDKATTPRGPAGDARPDVVSPDPRTGGGQKPERVEDRPNVSTVEPEDYPEQQ